CHPPTSKSIEPKKDVTQLRHISFFDFKKGIAQRRDKKTGLYSLLF
ncbi:hypothetical protein HMPREF1363_00101, partial [Enterococcus faecium ERV161]